MNMDLISTSQLLHPVAVFPFHLFFQYESVVSNHFDLERQWEWQAELANSLLHSSEIVGYGTSVQLGSSNKYQH
jgi:hypothetical protein